MSYGKKYKKVYRPQWRKEWNTCLLGLASPWVSEKALKHSHLMICLEDWNEA